MIDTREVERLVRRYLRECEGRITWDVYQEVQDLDPNAPPHAIARLVDLAVTRIAAEEDRAEAGYTLPNRLGEVSK